MIDRHAQAATLARKRKLASEYRDGNGERRSLGLQIACSAKNQISGPRQAVDLIAESEARKTGARVLLPTEKEPALRDGLDVPAKTASHQVLNLMNRKGAEIVISREFSESDLGVMGSKRARTPVNRALPQVAGEMKRTAQTRAVLSGVRGAASSVTVPDTLSGSFTTCESE